ncbi:hypothetical protein OHAE_61 [Ochrobactrum soli]|uniref:Uncharacterized protein n=1 Tax=Ochrobactrum soli TaxID=2448455 RepID=A0A2P9HJ67_9HYPH|nr:hypothetical protein OHAE_61 [[Ochrobactrum] soli]
MALKSRIKLNRTKFKAALPFGKRQALCGNGEALGGNHGCSI